MKEEKLYESTKNKKIKNIVPHWWNILKGKLQLLFHEISRFIQCAHAMLTLVGMGEHKNRKLEKTNLK